MVLDVDRIAAVVARLGAKLVYRTCTCLRASFSLWRMSVAGSPAMHLTLCVQEFFYLFVSLFFSVIRVLSSFAVRCQT